MDDPTMNSVKSLHEQIQMEIRAWLGPDVSVTRRVLQVLSVAAQCEDGWIDDAEVFCETLKRQPSLFDLFTRIGVNKDIMRSAVNYMGQISTANPEANHEISLEITLQHALGKRTKQYKHVRRTKRLTTADLIIGHLRYNLEGEVGSVLAHHLLDDAGIPSDYWNPQNRKYISNLIKRIESLEFIDGNMQEQQFVLYWDGSQYRFRPFGASGLYQIDDPTRHAIWTTRGNFIQPSTNFSPASFGELEYLINRRSAEIKFQKFFERHPEYLLSLGGGKYINAHPQVIMRQDDGSSLIPDFFLESINDHLCDICDLKLASQRLKKITKNRPGFRAAIYEAVAQLEYYRNWFEDKINRDAFYSYTGLRAYRFRVVVVVGRSQDYYTDVKRIQMEALLPNHVELITYDDILERASVFMQLATGQPR